MRILVEGSARHIHVTKEHLAILFGEGYALNNKRELSQPGQYLTDEKVTLKGPRGAIDRVSILGPERPATQAEISLTDARVLGVAAPVRESGDVAGSSPITIIGPAGEVELAEGCIVAKRHIHMRPQDAAEGGVADKQIISVKLGEGSGRATTFHDVVVRVSPSFMPAMHVDYDEMNAAGLAGEVFGEIIL